MKNVFNLIYVFYRKKKILVNKYKTQIVCYEKNNFFFDVVRNVHIFPQSEINYFEHDHRFLFSREMGTLEVGRK